MITKIWDKDPFCWTDVAAPTEQDLQSLTNDFGISALILQNCLSPEHLPQTISIGPNYYIVLRTFDAQAIQSADTIQELTQKLIIFVIDNHLITIWRKDQPCYNAFKEKMQSLPIKAFSVHEMVIKLFHVALQSYESAVYQATKDTDDHESRIFLRTQNTMVLKAMFFTKRRSILMRRLIEMSKEAARDLPHDHLYEQEKTMHTNKIDINQVDYLANKLIFRLSELLDMLAGLMNLHLSLAAHRTNHVIHVLTMFSVFFLPITFIAGVYGMNFEHMPELELKYGYVGALVMMAITSVSLFMWFKKKGWLK